MFGLLKIAKSLHKDHYRPDIDGIRAIAVLSVVICHAFPRYLPGGFIGVDIFFVLSGYLISSIIIRDIDSDRFSILKFYDRRIRRIFPALILVLLFTLVVGWAIMAQFEFQALGKHVAGSTLFSENFLLWSESSYFDVSSEKKQLLHLWSLAIEEQFYFFWPLALWLAGRGHVPFLTIFLLLGLASFATNIFDIHNDPTAAYYSPIGRFWELMVGSCLAYLQSARPALLDRFKNLQSWLGAALLVIAFALINPDRGFPGFWALLPTFGTFLLVSGGENSWINKHILSTSPFVWFGLISYPLYLWHWPLLSFAHITFGKVDPLKAFILVVIAIVAAAFTFLIIERPFRTRSDNGAKPAFLALGMVAMLAFGVLAMNRILPPRLRNLEVPARNEWTFLKSDNQKFDPNAVGVYKLYADRPELTLFIGDSHIAQYSERLNKVMGDDKARPGAILAIGGSCNPIEETYLNDVSRKNCWPLRIRAYEMAKESRFRTVVIGGAWNSYFDTPKFYIKASGAELPLTTPAGKAAALDSLGRRLAMLVKAGKRVVLVLDNPNSRDFNPVGPKARLTLSSKGLAPNRTIHVDPKQRELQEEIAAVGRRAGAEIVNPAAAICQRDTCLITSEKGLPLYKDANHFNPDWAIDHATFIDTTVSR